MSVLFVPLASLRLLTSSCNTPQSIEPCLLHSVGRRPVFRDEQGYERANDLVIDDNRVSGVHFEIWREFVTTRDEEGNEKVQTIVRLRDLSSNGTFVRRQKVGKGNITILHDGVDVALNVTSDVEINEKGEEVRVPSYCESCYSHSNHCQI